MAASEDDPVTAQSADSMRRELDSLRMEVAELRAERDRMAELLALVREKHEALLRSLYGKSSERYASDDDQPLFHGLDHPEPPQPVHVEEAPDAEEPEEPPAKGKRKKSRRRGATRISPDIPRRVEEVAPTDEESVCPCCGEQRVVLGYEETEKLEYEPASFWVRVIRRPKLVCQRHEEAGVVTPALPPQVIDKGLPAASMLAQVVTAKYRDHLPLNRQADIYARHGVDFSRSTLCDWIARASGLLTPVVDCMLRSARDSGYVATDDTGVTLLRPQQSEKKSKRAHLWVYLGEEPGDVVFDFTPGRGGAGPLRMLDGFQGHLQADAYSVYDQFFESGEIIEVGCAAHARRKFFDALPSCPEFAEPAMKAFKMLYAVERRAKAQGLGPEERLILRRAESAEIFAKLREWLAELKGHVLPQSQIGKAVGYFVRHADALGRFLENGRLEIDNNRCERAMRQVAVGRKNWLFAGSEAGGKSAATLYSLTVGCWELGIDPLVYLTDVLSRLGSTPSSRIEELTPRGWKAAREI